MPHRFWLAYFEATSFPHRFVNGKKVGGCGFVSFDLCREIA